MKLRFALLATTMMVIFGGIIPSSAVAAEPIEGTWLFNSGEVLVTSTGPGTFKGVVVKQTQFAVCPHLVGENMWAISGGGNDYTGTHNWLNNADCTSAGTGNAVWTILSTDPTKFELRFCTVGPGLGVPDASTSCNTLTRIRPPEPKLVPKQAAQQLPSAKKCKSRRKFRIRVRQLKDVTYKTVKITVRGRPVKVQKIAGRFTTTVDLKKLPPGKFVVKITITTMEGQTISGSRKYNTCAKKRKGGKIRL